MSITISAPETRCLELDNRRRAPRVNRQFNLRYQLTGQDFHPSLGLNLSASGARLILRGSATVGETTLWVELDEALSVQARTVWEQPLSAGDCRIAGVAFAPLEPHQDAAIQALMARLSAAN